MKFSQLVEKGEASTGEMALLFGHGRTGDEVLNLQFLIHEADRRGFDVTIFGHKGIARLYETDNFELVASAQCTTDVLERGRWADRISYALAAALIIAIGADYEVTK